MTPTACCHTPRRAVHAWDVPNHGSQRHCHRPSSSPLSSAGSYCSTRESSFASGCEPASCATPEAPTSDAWSPHESPWASAWPVVASSAALTPPPTGSGSVTASERRAMWHSESYRRRSLGNCRESRFWRIPSTASAGCPSLSAGTLPLCSCVSLAFRRRSPSTTL